MPFCLSLLSKHTRVFDKVKVIVPRVRRFSQIAALRWLRRDHKEKRDRSRLREGASHVCLKEAIGKADVNGKGVGIDVVEGMKITSGEGHGPPFRGGIQ